MAWQAHFCQEMQLVKSELSFHEQILRPHWTEKWNNRRTEQGESSSFCKKNKEGVQNTYLYPIKRWESCVAVGCVIKPNENKI